ncbi:hypothetical protein KY385_00715 [Candidatus Parcubacteria bacterium]|nr:hypothetical protein [Candidatus Parcubacteria bacterium]
MSFIKSTIKNAMQQKSVMRALNASLALLFVTSLALNIAGNNETADAAVKRQCVSPNTGKTLNLTKEAFQPANISISGSQAVATFKFPGQCAGQNIPITLVSYKAPNTPDNMPFSAQKYFSSVTRYYNQPRSNAQITVSVPACKFQVDLVLGEQSDIIRNFSDGHGSPNTYTGQKRMITAAGGGIGECFPAPAPTKPAQPAPEQKPAPAVNIVNTNENKNVNVNTVNVEEKEKKKVDDEVKVVTPKKEAVVVTEGKREEPAVAKLPDTGPGAVAPILFGATFMSSFLYSARSRYAEMVAKLIARF